jgi:hypothetical protein
MTNCVAPLYSWSHAFGLFSLGLCEGSVVQPKWIRLENSKHGSLQQLQMLKRGMLHVTALSKRWTIYEGRIQNCRCRLLWSIPHLTHFPFVCKKVFKLKNGILQTTPSYIFPLLRYRRLKPRHSFWYNLYFVTVTIGISEPSPKPSLFHLS